MQIHKVFQDWLNTNKITTQVQEDFNISFTEDIVFPVHDLNGDFSFNKYRRNPLDDTKPKYWYDKGGKVTLYGWHKAKDSKTILICEGEKDCLVAWSHNIPAVTSTGGALSFQEDWAELFRDKEVIICFDNDEAGANGTIKVLKYVPQAKVLFIPDRANMKDISDYVVNGGDLHSLIKTAKRLNTLEAVSDDKSRRLALYQSIYFHNAFIKEHTKVNLEISKVKTFSDDKVTNAKAYPMTKIMKFESNKARCPYHKEKSGSFTYFPKDNRCYCFGCGKSADAIDLYMKLHDCSFVEAVKQLNK